MKGIIPKNLWPSWTVHTRKTGEGYLQGIFVGGCVARGVGSSFRASAHAHTGDNKNEGWICFRSEKLFNCAGLGIHELAHILIRGGHCVEWGDRMMELFREYIDRENGVRTEDYEQDLVDLRKGKNEPDL